MGKEEIGPTRRAPRVASSRPFWGLSPSDTWSSAASSVFMRWLLAFLHPLAVLVLLILSLDGAPSDAVGAALLAVLLFGRDKCCQVNLLRVLGKVIHHTVRQVTQVSVWHRLTSSKSSSDYFTDGEGF